MPSIIEELSKLLPGSAEPWLKHVDPEDTPDVQAVFLAKQVCSLLAQGKAHDVRPFFVALEAAYAGAATEDVQLALYEGFMEAYISSLDDAPLVPDLGYDQLGPIAKGVWEDAWNHSRRQPWRPPGA